MKMSEKNRPFYNSIFEKWKTQNSIKNQILLRFLGQNDVVFQKRGPFTNAFRKIENRDCSSYLRHKDAT